MIDPRNPDFQNTPVSPRRPARLYAPATPPTTPLVSIITPFFNTGAEFHETARSVFAQSLTAWEWIIINDASRDPAALAILEQYRERDPRIRVIDQPENRGPSAARNAGIRAARAEFVIPLDADDLIEPTLLEKAIWFLLSHPRLAFVGTWSVAFGEQNYLWRNGFHNADDFLTMNQATIGAMLRRSVHQAVGGFDESITGGMEDWDFWLKCAAHGHWGATLPEFLYWYRRRADHSQRWSDWDRGERQAAFAAQLRQRYPRLFTQGVPRVGPPEQLAYTAPRETLPFENALQPAQRQLLMIVPWMTMGGADKFNLDLLAQLARRDWNVTIASTLPNPNTWAPEFARFTPDIFALNDFLPPREHPAFLRYLIQSRRPDVVLLTNSEAGYHLLPYLRSVCPAPAYVDYCHMEEDIHASGGYPRFAVALQDQLDLNIVASEHLQRWMIERGADPARVHVAAINVDANHWRPDAETRRRVRAELQLDPQIPVLLFAGRICPQKQPRVLADTLGQLARESLDFVCLIAGGGEDRPLLENTLRAARAMRHARMLGDVSSERVRELMTAADIFFLPSQWEGIALSIYEAMAMGLAVVGADVGGQRELVTPECGILIQRSTETAEAREYARQIQRLLHDPALRQSMGQAARQRVETHFALDQMGERMQQLFERAIRRKAEHPLLTLPPRLALEIATQALELDRRQRLADQLWREVERRGPRAETADARDLPQELALARLQAITSSRSWRTIKRLKTLSPYRWLADWRYGPGWESERPSEDPREALDAITRSRAYRLIRAVKRLPVYRWYARRKYGSEFEKFAP